ncbi:hypothetical protein [Gordonia sp. KTR9]|uniref:hypothetical protein n=1 Tax=Gordonia sp. KTR9 TaxID=337191 RepID=UPI00027DD9A1|nr:hypothetical protein [Gordonia sp. KTR9]AFR47976.1 hypothetical protein KTR9_1336 [Gordonia sp. KTR9]
MDSKFSVLPTIRAHYRTFVNDATGEPHKTDYMIALGAPAVTGLIVSATMGAKGLVMNEIGAYISGVAIFTALLFALVIYVFQLRMQLDVDQRVSPTGRLIRLVDQLFSNVNYAVVIGVATTVTAMIAAAFAKDGAVNYVWGGILATLGLHLVLVVLMCIKRVQSAFGQIRRLPRTTSV